MRARRTLRGMGALRFGTSSFAEPSWVGPFYPVGTRRADFLREYARRFGTVEIDATYYAVPSAATVDGWVARTPADFRIAAKFPRAVVHAGTGPVPDRDGVLVPERVASVTDEFLERMGRLGPRCGPLLLQFPFFSRDVFRERGPFLERLEAYLGALPPTFRYAVEVRNRDWLDGELCALLARRGASLVLTDIARMPHPADLAQTLDVLTTDFVYARLIGDRRQLDLLTDTWDRIRVDQDERLRDWVPLIERLLERAAMVYVFANNHYAGHAPATITDLAARLGIVLGERDEPPDAPRQGSLFPTR